jgi:predicted molibdopterin-dependent oxidoreductase YjgC
MNNSHQVGPGRGDQRRCSRGIDRGGQVRFLFDGRTITAHEGESIAAALTASRCRILRYTSRRGEPRGVFCNMGICFDCLVEIDGRPNQRACQSPVAEGIQVNTQQGVGGRVQS